MEYFVYIIYSLKFDKPYVGFTTNLDRRLYEHNSGKSKYTSKFKPWTLVYYEKVANSVDARKREKYYKSAAGRRKVKTIISDYLKQTNSNL